MSVYQKYFQQFREGFIGNSTMGLLGQSCMGSVAAMSVLQNGTSFFQMFQLFLVVCGCMMFNGAVLSQQKPKTVFNILIFSVVTSVVISVFNFIR